MNAATSEITITPDPQILQVLTYLEMRPIDSLCELIDNSLDALATQLPESGALVAIELPTRKEVEEGVARIRVRDNGPGMTLSQVENALRAGYSSKPRHGSLGLFGVGFNIATGKLGRVTKLITARVQDDYAIEVVVNLVSLKKAGNFKVQATSIPKPHGLISGTLVEVTEPWGKGNQNFEFMLKLVSLGRPKTLQQLGRIYATLLREKKARILVGDDTVEPYEHCVWADSRYVEHAKHGQIPAVYRYKNKVIHSYRKCAACEATIPDGETHCPSAGCECTSFITQEEKISGWIGIQRYLDASHFGLDLIRNGRAIRQLEKEAFFTFHDETGDPVVDYPIDNREGRIVGEIHLDHVPVDPAKQNFERSSPEWRRAIEFLRGASSLQPERPGADTNQSPIFKLYQGYRKVRTPGKRSMTMGKWLSGSTEPRALNRAEIEELRKRFDNHEPGYFDDAEWWKLVEQADNKPVPGLRKCPGCSLESPDGLDDCPHCGHVFNGKQCLNTDCSQLINKNAVTCPVCGAYQIPHVSTPWRCDVCGAANHSDHTECAVCTQSRGTPNPVARATLDAGSQQEDRLSVQGMSVLLANGDASAPLDLAVYVTDQSIRAYRADGSQVTLPSVRFIDSDIAIYLNPTHPLFERAGVSLEEQVAFEAAAYLAVYYSALAAKYPAEHSVTKLAHDILQKYWPEKFGGNVVDAELESLFASLRLKMAGAAHKESADIYANLSADERALLGSELLRRGRDISELAHMKTNGQFIHFLSPRGILEVFKINPKLFFDGHVWSVTYADIPSLHPDGGERLQSQIREQYGILLELAAMYTAKKADDPREAELAHAACKLLTSKLTE